MKKFPFLHLILFLLTMLSTLIVGALQTGADILGEPGSISKGIPFAVSLMTILLSHEFSHYYASKKHGVNATLPYFIPAPIFYRHLRCIHKNEVAHCDKEIPYRYRSVGSYSRIYHIRYSLRDRPQYVGSGAVNFCESRTFSSGTLCCFLFLPV